jgi:hypothetical protein
LIHLFLHNHARAYMNIKWLNMTLTLIFPILSLRDDQQYIPPTKPYELSALAADLVVLSRYLLKPGGRLVFFLPTVVDEYKELDLDSVVCDGMQIIANSLQDFGAWGRRVCIIPFSHCPSFFRAHKVLVLFKFGFVVSSVDHDPQSHVPIVPTTNLRFANSVATTSARRRSRPVVDPRPRPSRLPREVFSWLQEAIGRWIIMNARVISVNPRNHYSRVTLMIFF